MARTVIRLEEAELVCFHANYIYMWKKLNTAPYYVSGYGEPPAWIRGAELLPSYVNLSKCMNPDYVPSVNIVNKIVHFYNANIAPAIDTYTFLHETLELGDKGRTALACASNEPYCGMYYGYYYSEAEDEHYIRGALLRIFEADGELRAGLIYDITADEDLQSIALHRLLESDRLSERFAAFRDGLPLSKSLMALYTGSGKTAPGVVTLQFQRTDSDGEYLVIYLPVGSQTSRDYIGGLGMAFSVTQNRAFQIYRIGFERAGHRDMRPMSLNDTKLMELLSLSKGSNERVVMSPSDNTAWTNYMILREQ